MGGGSLARKVLYRIFSGSPSGRAPVLCYHSIDKTGSSCSVSPEEFERQMFFLKEAGYKGVALSRFIARPACREVAITFDDGFLNNYTDALPVLKRHDFTATFFIPVDYVGKTAGWLEDKGEFREMSAYPLMSWKEIRQMLLEGMEIGSHSASHPYLSSLSEQGQEREIRGSREILEDRLGGKITSFCYPSGDYNEKTIELVRKAGYTAACTTVWGAHKCADPLLIRRILIASMVSDEFPFYFCRGMDLYTSIRDTVLGKRP